MDQRSKIAVLGYGVEGKAMLDYLVKHKYDNITVCDQRVHLKEKMPDGVSVQLGECYLDNLENFDVVFRSPGISYLIPEIVKARLAGAEITSPTQYFLDNCPCIVVGVTGTKGKGTTSTLTYEILKEAFEKGGYTEREGVYTERSGYTERKDGGTERSGTEKKNSDAKMAEKTAIKITTKENGKKRHVYLGGNIGNSPIEFLDKLKGNDVVVLELSCFQLGDLKKSPHIAVLLNTTSDHLDYYPDRDEYLRAKELILLHQDEDDVAILNQDYEYSKYYESQVRGRLVWISPKGEDLSKGLDEEGAVYINSEDGTANKLIMYSRNGQSMMVMPVRDVALIGSHNIENVCPAIAVAKEFGIKDKVIAKVIKKFSGLPHRLEFVRKLNNVSYYNDSFSTNPQTSMAAVDSFDVPTILIAGGSDKGLDYYEWARKILIKPSLQVVLLIGATSEKMWDAIETAEKKLKPGEGSPTLVVMCKDLKEALQKAKKYAAGILKEGSVGTGEKIIPGKGVIKTAVVVMSPAAASFDQFKDYKDRGKKFIEWTKEL